MIKIQLFPGDKGRTNESCAPWANKGFEVVDGLASRRGEGWDGYHKCYRVRLLDSKDIILLRPNGIELSVPTRGDLDKVVPWASLEAEIERACKQGPANDY